MKIVLKRRKHRNGVRPTRKGTLKVNLQKLPTWEQHHDTMVEFRAFREKHANLEEAHRHLNAGNIVEFEKIIKLSKATGICIDAMHKAYTYLYEHRQINPFDLVFNVINHVDPIFNKPETMDEKCARCPINHNCSFKSYKEPEHRFRWCHMGTGAKFLTPLIQELTTAEMAELALTHLS